MEPLINERNFFFNNEAHELVQLYREGKMKAFEEKLGDLKAKGIVQNLFNTQNSTPQQAALRERSFQQFGRSNEMEHLKKDLQEVNAKIKEITTETKAPKVTQVFNKVILNKLETTPIPLPTKGTEKGNPLTITAQALESLVLAYERYATAQDLKVENLFSLLTKEKIDPNSPITLFENESPEIAKKFLEALAQPKILEKIPESDLERISFLAFEHGFVALERLCNQTLTQKFSHKSLEEVEAKMKELGSQTSKNEPLEKAFYHLLFSKTTDHLKDMERNRCTEPKTAKDKKILNTIALLLLAPQSNRPDRPKFSEIFHLLTECFSKNEMAEMVNSLGAKDKNNKLLKDFCRTAIEVSSNIEDVVKGIKKPITRGLYSERSSNISETSDPHLRDNKRVMLAAVKAESRVFEHASSRLQNDLELALIAVEDNGSRLRYASDDLKDNFKVVLTAVKSNAIALSDASEKLRGNKEIVLAAVQQRGYALYNASDDLKKDLVIVLAAVKQNGDALQHAHADLRKNKQVVLAAIEEYPSSIAYADESLQNDPEILAAVEKARKSNTARPDLV